MDNLDYTVKLFDYILNTERKRHIVGGILLSLAALFAGLAITSLTAKDEKEEKEKEEYEE